MIIRRHLTANYTVIDNAALQDTSLSWKATGMLAYLLSLPEDWRVHLADLEQRKTDGRTATESGFAELRGAGYVTIEKVRGGGGHLATVCHVYDEPLGTSTTRTHNGGLTGERENRGPVKPGSGKPGSLVSTQDQVSSDKPHSKEVAKQEFNAVWDWLDAAFGKPTQTQQAARARIVRSLLAEQATPELLAERAATWPDHFGDATLTEFALEKHWGRLGLPPRKATRQRVDQGARRADRAGLKEEL